MHICFRIRSTSLHFPYDIVVDDVCRGVCVEIQVPMITESVNVAWVCKYICQAITRKTFLVDNNFSQA